LCAHATLIREESVRRIPIVADYRPGSPANNDFVTAFW
jgi:hypothetical protein